MKGELGEVGGAHGVATIGQHDIVHKGVNKQAKGYEKDSIHQLSADRSNKAEHNIVFKKLTIRREQFLIFYCCFISIFLSAFAIIA